VAISAAALLLVAAPLMRGGNRQIALIGLEAIAIAFLLSLSIRTAMVWRRQPQRLHSGRGSALALTILVLSPAWLALVYLVPIPAVLWASLPGREIYPRLLSDAGIGVGAWLPLSLVPDATKASLLAGLPLVAAFLAGYFCRLSQLKVLLSFVAGMAILQTILGLLQISGGWHSSLFFGMEGDRPFGTFANPNHFANYLAMALTGYAWLASSSPVHSEHGRTVGFSARFAPGPLRALWVSGASFLVLGILMSRSRGAIVSGLPAAILAIGVLMLASSRTLSWRATFFLISSVLVVVVALFGLGALVSRFDLEGLSGSAEVRDLLNKSTLNGAGFFWPFGAGWGTYAAVYPRFQPAAVAGYVDYAHQDYLQALLEGGVFSVLAAASFLWLLASRAIRLSTLALRHKVLNSEEMAAAVCGLGLLGFLLHSLVESNMHIPANAILAAMLTGAYLRPLSTLNSSR
jgi:hypothetical protein